MKRKEEKEICRRERERERDRKENERKLTETIKNERKLKNSG